jgi:hypothetical protein
MIYFARALQLVGLLMTGYAAIAAFWIDFSEGAMFNWGIGGAVLFILGTGLQWRGA